MIKHIFILAFLVIMTGCATGPVALDMPALDESSSISVVDLRPDNEREIKNKIFSLAITSKAYGLYRLGNQVTEPNLIRLFQHKLHESRPDLAPNAKVKVHHLVVYSNLKSELRRSVTMGAALGPVGAVVASSTQKYGVEGRAELVDREKFNNIEKEYERALYGAEENPDKSSVMFVYLDAEIDGEREFIRTMTPLRFSKDDKRIPYVVAVETATSYFLDQL